MERKRSGLGIAAGILFGIFLLYEVSNGITFLVNRPSGYWNIDVMFWLVRQIADVCASVLMIISLFREKRSGLLLASHIINNVMFLWQITDILRNGSYMSLSFVTYPILAGSLILRTVMTVYICIPSLQEKAGWTGKIWFIPPVLSGIAVIFNTMYYPLRTVFNLLPNAISIVSAFLFCLWLTEPVRIKKDELQKENEKPKKGSHVKVLIITLILIVSIPVMMFVGFIFIMTYETNYYIFTKSRTEQMEYIFDITVTDDVKLLHYRDSSILIAIDECLTLEVSDYEQFINNNINADIEQYTPSYANDDTLYYKYANDRIYVEVTPSKNKDKYVVTINHSE